MRNKVQNTAQDFRGVRTTFETLLVNVTIKGPRRKSGKFPDYSIPDGGASGMQIPTAARDHKGLKRSLTGVNLLHA